MKFVEHVLVSDFGTFALTSDPIKGARLTKRGRPDRRTNLGKRFYQWEKDALAAAKYCAEAGLNFTPAEFYIGEKK